jgi:hypothetical protein
LVQPFRQVGSRLDRPFRLPSPGEDKEGRRAIQEDLSKTLVGGYVHLFFPRWVRQGLRARHKPLTVPTAGNTTTSLARIPQFR